MRLAWRGMLAALSLLAASVASPAAAQDADEPMILAFGETRFRVPRTVNGKPAVSLGSGLITSPPGLNNLGTPDADGVYRPLFVSILDVGRLGHVPPDFALRRAAETRARFEALKARSTVTVDEDGYWLVRDTYPNTYYGMRPEDVSPLGEPLEYKCEPPIDGSPRIGCYVRVSYYWSPDVSLRYDFYENRVPKSQWRARTAQVHARLRELEAKN